MIGKGIIKFFLILMLLVTVWQYLLILPTSKVESAADRYAEEMTVSVSEEDANFAFGEARRKYLDSMSTEVIFGIPGLKDYTYEDLKKSQLGLGLDLKGGMSMVLQVDLKDFLLNLSKDNPDPNFRKSLDLAKERLKNAQDDYITLFVEEYNKISDARPLSAIFARSGVISDEIDRNSSNGEVERVIRQKANETVELTFSRLKERIDRMGALQPNITLDAGRDLIIVELPGVENPERAKDYIQTTANLEFWKTYRFNDAGLGATFNAANDQLMEQERLKNNLELDSLFSYVTDSLTGDTLDRNFLGIDRNPENGPLYSRFSINGVSQEGALGFPSSVMGSANKNQRDEVLSLLNRPSIKSLFPPDIEFKWSQKPYVGNDNVATNNYFLYALKKDRGNKAHLDGEHVTNARPTTDQMTGNMAVSLQMDGKGTQVWADLTTEAAQQGNREIAILLDDAVISAPSVQSAITGGTSQITGGFTLQEAQDLSNKLEVGKLPAKTTIIQDNVVGPSLGAKNISSSLISLLLGLMIVLAFMIFYYGRAGIVSILALILNLIFIIAALAGMGVVLTLPGVAGVVLTIGMAVDANVIIFERVREELRIGKKPIAAVKDGFRNSYSAIIDANVTTILTAIVLFVFGLGPIKGFAVVLIIGIVSSLFTAVVLGRMMIEWWMNGGKSMSFWTPMTKNAFSNLQIDWLSKKKLAYIISGSFIGLGIFSMIFKNFELGVDFKGGYSYNISFPSDVSVDRSQLYTALNESFENQSTSVKAVSTSNTYNIVTSYLVEDQDENASSMVMQKLHEGVQEAIGRNIDFELFKLPTGSDVHVSTSAKVGPTIADDIKTSSRWATIFALLLIFLYIFVRFNNWQYSLGAVAALLHDTLILLGVFAAFHGLLGFSMEINQPFIAALLTVIGYSINDTVVVFDRIREYLGIYSDRSKNEVINMAINSTVSRTIITSVTTLFVVLVLFIFGGESIKGFAFALVIGVVVGTYSSIFVATPIMSDFSKELKAKSKFSSKRFSKALSK